MERRKFLIGVGTAAAGGSALVGSGAFSRVESQRVVSIDVAEDPDAYLGLDGCDGGENSSFTEINSGTGHLEIQMGESGNGGEGVNSNSNSWFDEVFGVQNQGKADAAFTLDDTHLTLDAGIEVDFYHGDDRETSLLDDNWVDIGVGGDQECVGIHVDTTDYSGGPTEGAVSGHLEIIADTDGSGS